jgi:hypothetical protein
MASTVKVAGAPALREAIVSRWGSHEAFVKAFGAELLGLQGVIRRCTGGSQVLPEQGVIDMASTVKAKLLLQ